MGEIHYIGPRELTSNEILREINAGNRIIIEINMLGRSLRMALRQQDGTYYCDTPIRLFSFQSAEEMRECLERFRLARQSQQTMDERDSSGQPA